VSYIKVIACADPMRWYAGSIGKSFKRIRDGQECVNKEWKTRDCQGYVNFIQWADSELIQEEEIYET
jgi:hypothetical protein